MRLVLAALALALSAAGCSLLYNPNNIDKAPSEGTVPDAEVIVDADPSSLALTQVTPAQVIEGQGIDGSRQAVVVVRGDQFVSGAVIELLVHTTGLPHPSIMLDQSATKLAQVAANHKMIAVPVTVNIDPNDGDIALDVRVTQMAAGSMVSRTLENALTLHGLPVIDVPAGAYAITAMSTQSEYTFAKVTARSLTIAGDRPLSIRSMSSLTVLDPIDTSAHGVTPGILGGNRGGVGGAGGLIPTAGSNGEGDCGGAGGAVGEAGKLATFGAAEPGANPCTPADVGMSVIASSRSSGGGGGGGASFGAGDTGGAGGGTLELTADGNLMIGTYTSKGGAGETSRAGGEGGPGSGGGLLLRAGGTLVTGVLDVDGGAGPGAGGFGKIRFDNAAQATTANATRPTYRGPMLASSTPLLVTDPVPTLTIYGKPMAPFKLYIEGLTNELLDAARPPVTLTFTAAGSTSYKLEDASPLYRGDNRVCVEVEAASTGVGRPEARNCIELVYLLQQGQ